MIKHLIFLLFIFFHLFSSGQLPNYAHYDHKKGLITSGVWSIKQTKSGEILLGTQGEGIISFDRGKFKTLLKTDKKSYPNFFISDIIEVDDELYFADKYKGIFRITKSGEPEIIWSKKNCKEILKLLLFQNDFIVIHTNGIFKINKKTHLQQLLLKSHENKAFTISQLIESPKGIVILSNLGNYFVDDQKCIPLTGITTQENKILEKSKFGYFDSHLLQLFSEKLDTQYTFQHLNDSIFRFVKSSELLDAPQTDEELHATYNVLRKCFTIVTSDGKISELSKSLWTAIPFNCRISLNQVNTIISDFNGDYWLSSSRDGLTKVSYESFTKIALHSETLKKHINFTKKLNSKKILFSTSYDGSYLFDLAGRKIKRFDLTLFSASYYNKVLYCGTSKGVMVFDEMTNSFRSANIPSITNEHSQLVFCDGENIWISQQDNGLVKYNFRTKEVFKFSKKMINCSEYSYCAEISKDGSTILVGGNNGIFQYSKNDQTCSPINSNKMGSYCGNSTKDIFGTVWFTIDKGIIGITNNKKVISIESDTYFPSTLFYTLIADQNGSLILGTNRGLHFLQVNESGKVLSNKNYNHKNGFLGYETNMRSASIWKNEIYVGTIEGLFLINTNYLSPNINLLKPNIKISNSEINSELGRLRFQLSVKNTKNLPVLYSYRIKENNKKWSPFIEKNDYLLENLKPGNYTLQVRASYNQKIKSAISESKFSITHPIYKSFWFLLPLVIVIIIAITAFSSDKSNIRSISLSQFDATSVQQGFISKFVLFGVIANMTSEGLIILFSNEIKPSIPMFSIFLVLHAITYIISLIAEKKEQDNTQRISLSMAYLVISSYYLIRLLQSDLNPFYAIFCIGICLTSPYVFSKLKWVALFSINFFLAGLLITYFTEYPILNAYHFILSLAFSVLLSVIIGYSYFSTIEKLQLRSAIIENSNVITIAYDRQNRIQFLSKNIENIFNLDVRSLLLTPVNNLIKAIDKGASFSELTQIETSDNPEKIIPLIGKDKNTIWLSFIPSFQDSRLSVLTATDVTEKMNIQSTNTILLENADDLIFKLDLNGVFDYVNGRFKDKLGYEKEDLIGKDSINIIGREYQEKARSFYANHFKLKLKLSYLEFPIVKKDGTYIWVGQNLSTIFHTEKEHLIDGFIAVSRDITNQKQQEKLIKSQTDDIFSSISFANQIQEKTHLLNSEIHLLYPDSFILYKPKSQVSGDFYWTKLIENYTIIAVGDSGMQGITGGFISLICMNILNSIMSEYITPNPGKILDKFEKRLYEYLPDFKSNDKEVSRISISICITDHRTNELSYATAGARIIIHDGNHFNLFKGDNKQIGEPFTKDFKGYVTHHIQLQKKNSVYLFSDGFQNQFGGRKQQKYSFKRFVELLDINIRLPFEDQKMMMLEELEQWKLNKEQTDDITVIGFLL